MPAKTDLSWGELNTIVGENIAFFFPRTDTSSTVATERLYLDMTALTGESVSDITQQGVIKGLSKLLDIARKAQEKANEGRPAGERLAAFPTPTAGNTANGFVPITRSISARHELASATNIVGTTA